jgi:hypothetical protein
MEQTGPTNGLSKRDYLCEKKEGRSGGRGVNDDPQKKATVDKIAGVIERKEKGNNNSE